MPMDGQGKGRVVHTVESVLFEGKGVGGVVALEGGGLNIMVGGGNAR